jgi:hypothetical protein
MFMSPPVIMNWHTPVALMACLPFSLNLNETLSLTINLGALELIFSTTALISSKLIAEGSPARPQRKLEPMKTMLFFLSLKT